MGCAHNHVRAVYTAAYTHTYTHTVNTDIAIFIQLPQPFFWDHLGEVVPE